MNEQTKSLIRHIVTGLGAVVAFLGIGELTNLIEYLTTNFDTIIGAVQVIIGAVISAVGFFKNKDRFVERPQ